MPYIPYNSMMDEVERSLQARESTIRLLKHHLTVAQSGMKAQADKKRSFIEFAVGDMVYARLQSYRQMSLKVHSYYKLNPKYFGPFPILKRVGSVAYQLQLHTSAKIHSTFHVSQLKKHIGDAPVVSDFPVTLSSHGHVILEPEEILETRKIMKHNM